MSRRVLLRIIDRLRDPIAIAKVDEYESSMVTTVRDPSRESDSLSDMCSIEFASGMCSVHSVVG